MTAISLVNHYRDLLQLLLSSKNMSTQFEREDLMSRHLLVVPLMLCTVLITTNSPVIAQDTPMNLPGLTTNQLLTPGQPTSPGTNCSTGCGTPWTYAVTASDFTGGSTVLGATNSVSAWSTLNSVQYTYLTTPTVSGAKNCTVWRIPSSGNPTPLPKGTNVPCGSMVYDFSGGTSVAAPLTNTTGGVNAAGTVAAAAFNAINSTGVAGATILTQAASAVPSCATNPPPCISNASEFFFEAPTSTISESWGIQLPASAPVQSGAFLLPAGTGTNFNLSTAAVSTLTDPSWTGTGTPPTLATVTGTLSAFNKNDLVSIAIPSSGDIDFTDSQINLGTGSTPQIPYANETIPTFDSTGTGLAAPAGNASFTFLNSATNGLTLSGNPPGSVSGNGTNAMPLITINGVTGGASASTGANTGGIGSSPVITAGNGGAATGTGTTSTVGGAGGTITINSGAGGAGQSGSDSGGSGGNETLTTGTGGLGSGGGAGGQGGTMTVMTGAGGTAGSSGTGGLGGGFTTMLGNGSPGGTTGNGAIGGTATILTGNGGGATGTGNSGANGGGFSLTTGNGGTTTGSSGVSGNGGSVAWTTGTGGNAASTGTTGNGGGIVYTLGAGGIGATPGQNGTLQVTGTVPSAVSTSTGATVGTLFNVTGVTGGADSATTGTAGAGSSVSINSGTGGAASGATSGSGGAAGTINFTTGNGGGASGGGTNASGGNLTITLGKAGTGGSGAAGVTGQFIVAGTSISSSSGLSAGTLFNVQGLAGGANTAATGTGGVGSAVSITGGAGGPASGGTAGTGGAGGTISLTAGAGGAGSAAGANANGGSIVLTPGAAGTIGGGAAGLAGVISVNSKTTLGGSNAGFLGLAEGAANTTANANIPANTIIDQAPTAVTAYSITRPGTAASGMVIGSASGSSITEAISGDSNHSTVVTISSNTSIISPIAVCSSGYCPAGTYRVNVYMDITTACTSGGTYKIFLTWTDDGGLKSAFLIPIIGTGSTTGTLDLSSASNWGGYEFILRSTGTAGLLYSTNAGACGSGGPAAGKLYLSVEIVQ
jgi:hypothetical protein